MGENEHNENLLEEENEEDNESIGTKLDNIKNKIINIFDELEIENQELIKLNTKLKEFYENNYKRCCCFDCGCCKCGCCCCDCFKDCWHCFCCIKSDKENEEEKIRQIKKKYMI